MKRLRAQARGLGLACVVFAVSLISSISDGQTVIYTRANAPSAPAVEQMPLRDAVTKDDVTWRFQKAVPVGRFVNGDFYVVGPATVVEIQPAPLWGDEVKDVTDYEKERRKTEELIRNGTVLNPPAANALTNFDSRSRNFTANGRVRPPIELKPGDVLVSSVSEATPHAVSGGTSPIKSVSLLTCLREPVPADAFRPSYGDRSQTIYLARNLHRERLLNLPVPAGAPDYRALARDYSTPWLEIHYYGVSATRSQRPYGRANCQAGVEACLSLLLDYPAEEKEPLLIGYVQYGIDLYGLVKNGHPGWIGDGGWGAGRKWPMVFAGLMLDRPEMTRVSREFPATVLAEDHQVYYDDCWTGAGVCFAFDNKNGSKRADGWGAYEHWHPSRWDSAHGQYYRCDMTGSTWVGQALIIHMLRAEKAWDGAAFLDYCDRWMYEPDPGFGTWGKQGEGYRAWPWFKEMWEKYRTNPPTPSPSGEGPWPTDGWKRKNPPKDSDSVAVAIGPCRELRVRGEPFFPLMMWAETPKRIPLAKALGMNTIAEGNFLSAELDNAVSNKEFLDEAAKAGLYGIFGADMRVAGHPNLLGWIHVDEPDRVLGRPASEWRRLFPGFEMMLFTPDQRVPKVCPPQEIVSTAWAWMKKVGPTRPVFLTLGGQMLPGEGSLDQEVKDKEFPAYLPYCDFVSCAVYPLTAGHAAGRTSAVASALAHLRKMAGPDKPLFAWVEAGPRVTGVVRHAQDIRAARQQGVRNFLGTTTGPAPTALQVRAEAWMAVIAGASALGYRGFEGFADMSLDPAVEAELKRINGQIARLAREILAPASSRTVRMVMDGAIPCHWKATEEHGVLTLFCQSLDESGRGAAEIFVSGLRQGAVVEVVDEGRTLSAQEEKFTDAFAPLGEHIYRIRF